MSHYLRALFSRAHLALGAKARHSRPRLQLLAGGDQGRFAHVFTLEIPFKSVKKLEFFREVEKWPSIPTGSQLPVPIPTPFRN